MKIEEKNPLPSGRGEVNGPLPMHGTRELRRHLGQSTPPLANIVLRVLAPRLNDRIVLTDRLAYARYPLMHGPLRHRPIALVCPTPFVEEIAREVIGEAGGLAIETVADGGLASLESYSPCQCERVLVTRWLHVEPRRAYRGGDPEDRDPLAGDGWIVIRTARPSRGDEEAITRHLADRRLLADELSHTYVLAKNHLMVGSSDRRRREVDEAVRRPMERTP